MAIELTDLIDELKTHAPKGVEIPRDPVTNGARTSTMQRWAEDAAQAINERRGKTTRKEQMIETEADVQEYDLAEDCREVVKIDRLRESPISTAKLLDIPRETTLLGIGGFGTLPSGQEISPAIDLIARQNLTRHRREDDYEIVGAQIRFLFPITGGETIKVTYKALDRSLASLTSDRFELVLTYMRWKNIERFVGREGANIAIDEDGFQTQGMPILIRQAASLEREWFAGLNSIPREAN